MPTYTAPVDDMQFVLHDLLQIDQYSNISGFDEATPDVTLAILKEGAKLSQELLQPLNQSGDREGCHWNDGVVATPKGFKEAYRTYIANGWGGLTGNPDYGGQGLPYVLGLAMAEMAGSANLSFSLYPGLTHGVVEGIAVHGTEEQQRRYLPKMISGEWSGTMNLTEPHCGTDLGLLRTKAEPQADGSYRITGTKIFISAGEHDLTENIIHLVLARIPGGPPGVKGISLFIVPKVLVTADGRLGERNTVFCGSIEDKMGIHGNATCVLNYDAAVGYLIGEQHQGLKAMFSLMNPARLMVGVQGLSMAEIAYQNAVIYARERLQGRSLSGPKAPDQPADPIIVHPDIRRMLMTARAFIEGARALAYWAGVQVDLAAKHPDESLRQEAKDLLALLTPIIKAYFTDKGFELTNLALQCYGGHGYIREWGMEQFVRDARIAQIYEGTNGIQALDLVGRKLPAHGGRAVQLLFSVIGQYCQEHHDNADLESFIKPLERAFEHLQRATSWLRQHAVRTPEQGAAGSMDYLHLMGLVVLGYQWAQMARIAQEKLAGGTGNQAFWKNKLITARFFMERILPDTAAHLTRIQAGAATLMALDAEAF